MHRMGNTLPRTIQLELLYDTSLIRTSPFDKHAISYFLKFHRANAADLSFSLAVVFSKFLFLLTGRDDCIGKSEERNQAVYPKDTSVK